jgi:hypothetical protein
VSIVRLRLATVLMACVVVAACGSAGTAAKRPAGASTAPADPAAVARCQQLAQRHVTPCPPAALPRERIGVRNDTNGAVADADARAAGEAYLRVHALYVWAVHQDGGDAFLLSGAIVPPETGRTNIYRAEASIFASARAAGGRAHIEPLTTTQITLVPVPRALQDLARRDGLQPSPYAWVDNQMGPAHAWIETPGGGSRDVLRIAAGQPHPILVFGQVRNDAELGSIWFVGGEFGCLADPNVRVVCAV